jgi:hypothetical protein
MLQNNTRPHERFVYFSDSLLITRLFTLSNFDTRHQLFLLLKLWFAGVYFGFQCSIPLRLDKHHSHHCHYVSNCHPRNDLSLCKTVCLLVSSNVIAKLFVVTCGQSRDGWIPIANGGFFSLANCFGNQNHSHHALDETKLKWHRVKGPAIDPSIVSSDTVSRISLPYLHESKQSKGNGTTQTLLCLKV